MRSAIYAMYARRTVYTLLVPLCLRSCGGRKIRIKELNSAFWRVETISCKPSRANPIVLAKRQCQHNSSYETTTLTPSESKGGIGNSIPCTATTSLGVDKIVSLGAPGRNKWASVWYICM